MPPFNIIPVLGSQAGAIVETLVLTIFAVLMIDRGARTETVNRYCVQLRAPIQKEEISHHGAFRLLSKFYRHILRSTRDIVIRDTSLR